MKIVAKRLLGVALVVMVALALQAPAGAGGQRQPRKVEVTYQTPMFYPVPASCSNSLGCVQVIPGARERFVHVEVADTSGTAPYAYVNQDWDGDGVSDIDGAICGRTESPLRIVPGIPINIFVLASWIYCPTGIGTTGTVTAILGSSYATVEAAGSQ